MLRSLYHPIFNDDPPEFAVGNVLGGHYRVVQPLLRGGMGELYAAVHVKNGRRLAVKTHMQRRAKRMEDFARFENEVRFLQFVQVHPNVVEYVDHGVLPDRRRKFLVTELLEGGSARWNGPAGRCRAALEVARGLCHIHARGVIHRDIKPGNIHIGEAVKILDFGIAIERGTRAVAGDGRLTREGQAIGTYDYMPPEQFTLAVPEPAADVYALGSTLFQWLANGHTPFGPGTRAELLEAKTTGQPRFLLSFGEHPEPIQRCVLDCLHPCVEDRIADAQTFIARLEAAMRAVGWAMQGGDDADTDTHVAPRVGGGRWPGRIGAMALGLGALSGTTFAWLRTEADREEPTASVGSRAHPGQARGSAESVAVTRGDRIEQASMNADGRDGASTNMDGTDRTSTNADLVEQAGTPVERVRTAHARSAVASSPPRVRSKAKSVSSIPETASTEPEASECAATRDAARDALAAFDWAALLLHTERRACWRAASDWERKRVLALAESGRLEECERVGTHSKDEHARFVATMCAAKAHAKDE